LLFENRTAGARENVPEVAAEQLRSRLAKKLECPLIHVGKSPLLIQGEDGIVDPVQERGRLDGMLLCSIARIAPANLGALLR
jgi:hypothetical protein